LEEIPGISYEIDYMAKPNASPFETSFAKHIQSATATALGMDSVSMVPGISTGFTDSRFTRPLGTITYGFSAMHPEDDPMISFVHGTNESIGINSLINSAKVMVILAHNMLAN
jgi:acetylornithine deacetylase/succinyl-diaminopimelate desuccinylase-like protein